MVDTKAGEQGPGSESLLTVVIALVMNALIAVAKSVVALITGSASMVAGDVPDLHEQPCRARGADAVQADQGRTGRCEQL
jgi:hypothetical protein